LYRLRFFIKRDDTYRVKETLYESKTDPRSCTLSGMPWCSEQFQSLGILPIKSLEVIIIVNDDYYGEVRGRRCVYRHCFINIFVFI